MTDLPDRMSAAYICQRGSAEAIRYGTLPIPAWGPTDVLVRVQAVAVNQVDTFVRSGAYATELSFPFIVGRDLVGTVAARGAGITDLEIGDPVWANSLGHGGRQGTAAEYAVVAAERLYRLPRVADPINAVALVHPAATAHLAMVARGGLHAGETVLIAGGAGHVGRAATILAAHAGARIIATAGADDLDTCRSIGAHLALDYRHHDLPSRLQAAVDNGVNIYLDTSGKPDLDLAIRLLSRGGRVVVMAGLDQRPQLPIGALYTRDAHILGFALSTANTRRARTSSATHQPTPSRWLAPGAQDRRTPTQCRSAGTHAPRKRHSQRNSNHPPTMRRAKSALQVKVPHMPSACRGPTSPRSQFCKPSEPDRTITQVLQLSEDVEVLSPYRTRKGSWFVQFVGALLRLPR